MLAYFPDGSVLDLRTGAATPATVGTTGSTTPSRGTAGSQPIATGGAAAVT
jgi:hypothetical protein